MSKPKLQLRWEGEKKRRRLRLPPCCAVVLGHFARNIVSFVLREAKHYLPEMRHEDTLVFVPFLPPPPHLRNSRREKVHVFVASETSGKTSEEKADVEPDFQL